MKNPTNPLHKKWIWEGMCTPQRYQAVIGLKMIPPEKGKGKKKIKQRKNNREICSAGLFELLSNSINESLQKSNLSNVGPRSKKIKIKGVVKRKSDSFYNVITVLKFDDKEIETLITAKKKKLQRDKAFIDNVKNIIEKENRMYEEMKRRNLSYDLHTRFQKVSSKDNREKRNQHRRYSNYQDVQSVATHYVEENELDETQNHTLKDTGSSSSTSYPEHLKKGEFSRRIKNEHQENENYYQDLAINNKGGREARHRACFEEYLDKKVLKSSRHNANEQQKTKRRLKEKKMKNKEEQIHGRKTQRKASNSSNLSEELDALHKIKSKIEKLKGKISTSEHINMDQDTKRTSTSKRYMECKKNSYDERPLANTTSRTIRKHTKERKTTESEEVRSHRNSQNYKRKMQSIKSRNDALHEQHSKVDPVHTKTIIENKHFPRIHTKALYMKSEQCNPFRHDTHKQIDTRVLHEYPTVENHRISDEEKEKRHRQKMLFYGNIIKSLNNTEKNKHKNTATTYFDTQQNKLDHMFKYNTMHKYHNYSSSNSSSSHIMKIQENSEEEKQEECRKKFAFSGKLKSNRKGIKSVIHLRPVKIGNLDKAKKQDLQSPNNSEETFGFVPKYSVEKKMEASKSEEKENRNLIQREPLNKLNTNRNVGMDQGYSTNDSVQNDPTNKNKKCTNIFSYKKVNCDNDQTQDEHIKHSPISNHAHKSEFSFTTKRGSVFNEEGNKTQSKENTMQHSEQKVFDKAVCDSLKNMHSNKSIKEINEISESKRTLNDLCSKSGKNANSSKQSLDKLSNVKRKALKSKKKSALKDISQKKNSSTAVKGTKQSKTSTTQKPFKTNYTPKKLVKNSKKKKNGKSKKDKKNKKKIVKKSLSKSRSGIIPIEIFEPKKKEEKEAIKQESQLVDENETLNRNHETANSNIELKEESLEKLVHPNNIDLKNGNNLKPTEAFPFAMMKKVVLLKREENVSAYKKTYTMTETGRTIEESKKGEGIEEPYKKSKTTLNKYSEPLQEQSHIMRSEGVSLETRKPLMEYNKVTETCKNDDSIQEDIHSSSKESKIINNIWSKESSKEGKFAPLKYSHKAPTDPASTITTTNTIVVKDSQIKSDDLDNKVSSTSTNEIGIKQEASIIKTEFNQENKSSRFTPFKYSKDPKDILHKMKMNKFLLKKVTASEKQKMEMKHKGSGSGEMKKEHVMKQSSNDSLEKNKSSLPTMMWKTLSMKNGPLNKNTSSPNESKSPVKIFSEMPLVKETSISMIKKGSMESIPQKEINKWILKKEVFKMVPLKVATQLNDSTKEVMKKSVFMKVQQFNHKKTEDTSVNMNNTVNKQMGLIKKSIVGNKFIFEKKTLISKHLAPEIIKKENMVLSPIKPVSIVAEHMNTEGIKKFQTMEKIQQLSKQLPVKEKMNSTEMQNISNILNLEACAAESISSKGSNSSTASLKKLEKKQESTIISKLETKIEKENTVKSSFIKDANIKGKSNIDRTVEDLNPTMVKEEDEGEDAPMLSMHPINVGIDSNKQVTKGNIINNSRSTNEQGNQIKKEEISKIEIKKSLNKMESGETRKELSIKPTQSSNKMKSNIISSFEKNSSEVLTNRKTPEMMMAPSKYSFKCSSNSLSNEEGKQSRTLKSDTHVKTENEKKNESTNKPFFAGNKMFNQSNIANVADRIRNEDINKTHTKETLETLVNGHGSNSQADQTSTMSKSGISKMSMKSSYPVSLNNEKSGKSGISIKPNDLALNVEESSNTNEEKKSKIMSKESRISKMSTKSMFPTPMNKEKSSKTGISINSNKYRTNTEESSSSDEEQTNVMKNKSEMNKISMKSIHTVSFNKENNRKPGITMNLNKSEMNIEESSSSDEEHKNVMTNKSGMSKTSMKSIHTISFNKGNNETSGITMNSNKSGMNTEESSNDNEEQKNRMVSKSGPSKISMKSIHIVSFNKENNKKSGITMNSNKSEMNVEESSNDDEEPKNRMVSKSGMSKMSMKSIHTVSFNKENNKKSGIIMNSNKSEMNMEKSSSSNEEQQNVMRNKSSINKMSMKSSAHRISLNNEKIGKSGMSNHSDHSRILTKESINYNENENSNIISKDSGLSKMSVKSMFPISRIKEKSGISGSNSTSSSNSSTSSDEKKKSGIMRKRSEISKMFVKPNLSTNMSKINSEKSGMSKIQSKESKEIKDSDTDSKMEKYSLKNDSNKSLMNSKSINQISRVNKYKSGLQSYVSINSKLEKERENSIEQKEQEKEIKNGRSMETKSKIFSTHSKSASLEVPKETNNSSDALNEPKKLSTKYSSLNKSQDNKFINIKMSQSKKSSKSNSFNKSSFSINSTSSAKNNGNGNTDSSKEESLSEASSTNKVHSIKSKEDVIHLEDKKVPQSENSKSRIINDMVAKVEKLSFSKNGDLIKSDSQDNSSKSIVNDTLSKGISQKFSNKDSNIEIKNIPFNYKQSLKPKIPPKKIPPKSFAFPNIGKQNGNTKEPLMYLKTEANVDQDQSKKAPPVMKPKPSLKPKWQFPKEKMNFSNKTPLSLKMNSSVKTNNVLEEKKSSSNEMTKMKDQTRDDVYNGFNTEEYSVVKGEGSMNTSANN